MITSQDLIDRFGEFELIQITNEQPRHDSVIDDVVLQGAINDAISEVASYLLSAGLVKVVGIGNVVYLPSSEIPSDLKKKTCDVARYNLYDNGILEVVQTRYDAAIKWLDKVKKDPTMLTGPVSEQPNISGGITVMPNPTPTYWDM
jgi:phage gp36-like protein